MATQDRLFLHEGRSGQFSLRWKRYFREMPGTPLTNLWPNQMRSLDKRYIVQTAELTTTRAMLMSTDPGDLVLDITCGSGTTAAVAEKWGRRWITCDTSPVSVAITRQRIAAQTYTYHVLKDSKEGAQEEAKIVSELGGDSVAVQPDADYGNDPAMGFVLERVHSVSAETLAYDLPGEYVEFVDRPVETRGKVRLASPFTVESATSAAFDPISFSLGADVGFPTGIAGGNATVTNSASGVSTSHDPPRGSRC